MLPSRIGIVADDLTGALDAAAPFSVRGLSVFVPLDPSRARSTGRDVVSLTTESRSMTPSGAVRAVRDAALRLRSDTRWIYKKIDSLLRGNVGEEAEAIREACRAELVLLAPAFPAQGRTLVGGRVYVHGRSLAAVMSEADPLTRRGVDALEHILSYAAVLRLTDVRGGTQVVADRLAEIRTGTVVADAETEEDMRTLARAVLRCRRRVLPCGSAGLASALAEELAKHPIPRNDASEKYAGRPVFVVVGSQSAAACEQTAELGRRSDVVLAILHGRELYTTRAETVVAQLTLTLKRNGTAALVLEGARDLLDSGVVGGTGAEVTALAAGRLGSIASEVVRQARPGSLVLTGGATAMGVLAALDSAGLE
ncbi:MAG: four-carbon acid sugar kinase family protein, partial [Armatimonadota bacterium]